MILRSFRSIRGLTTSFVRHPQFRQITICGDDLTQTKVDEFVDGIISQFNRTDVAYSVNPKCIMPPKGGSFIKAEAKFTERMALKKTIDINLKVVLADIERVLVANPNEKVKGPVVVVRGVGGGKTRALITLADALLDNDTLPITITYNGAWQAKSDLEIYKKLGLNDTMVYALGVVSRVLSTLLDVKPHMVTTALKGRGDYLKKIEHGSIFLGHVLSSLAKKGGKSRIVLLVDEVVAAENMMGYLFSGQKDFTQTLRHGLLNHQYNDANQKAALVISSLAVIPAGFTTSDKNIYPFILSERLNATEVVNDWWLTAVDAKGKETPIKLMNDVKDRKVLTLLAHALNALPRALEIVKDVIDIHVDDNTLKVSVDLVNDVFANLPNVMANLYPQLKNDMPSAELMFHLMYGEKCSLSALGVTKGISSSLFVNSIEEFDPTAMVELHSSVASLFAAIPPGTSDDKESVAGRLVRMNKSIIAMIMMPLTELKAGDVLEELSFNWLAVMLQTAIEARKDSVILGDLLRVDELRFDETSDTLLAETILSAAVDLPKRVFGRVREYRMKHSSREDPMQFFTELNTLKLNDMVTCVQLLSKNGDCWDSAFAFREWDENDKLWVLRIVFLENKSCSELSSNPRKLPDDFTLINTNNDKSAGCQFLDLQQIARDFALDKPEFLASPGFGSVVASGQFLYVYQTTLEGHSYVTQNCLTLGRADTERFFGFNYDLFAAVAEN